MNESILGTKFCGNHGGPHPMCAECVETIGSLLETIRWMAQTFHQGHHIDQAGTFRECPKNTCDAVRQAIDLVLKVKP